MTALKEFTAKSAAEKAACGAEPGRAKVWRIAGSVLVWLLILIALSAFVSLLIPGKYLNAADGVNGSYRVLVNKLAEFLPSREKADVLLLGSSLVLVPAVRCDDRMNGVLPCYDGWYYDRYIPEYSKASYLESLLRKNCRRDLKVSNLGVASSIMSDQYGIFKLLLAENKAPSLIILGVAPRDFLDNTQVKHLETPSRLFIREYNEAGPWPRSFSASELVSFFARSQHRVEKVLSGLRRASTDLACRLSGHRLSPEINSSNPYLGDRPNILKDLDRYKKLYNPPNFNMLAQQSEYLRRFLAEAERRNIAVLLVNMPLTRENTSSLAAEALQSYKESLSSLSRQYAAVFLDIGSSNPDFNLSDFEDCCHLNTEGGLKFYELVLASICGNEKLAGSLKEKPRSSTGIAVKDRRNDVLR